MRKIFYALMMATMLFGMFLIGCETQSPINQENYSRIEVGMSYSDVVALLGEPDECASARLTESCTWEEEEKRITVNFVNEKVYLFSSSGLK